MSKSKKWGYAIGGREVRIYNLGMKDMTFRKKELKMWMNVFPQVRVVRFEDAGHFVPEEKPEEVIGEMKKMIK